MTVSISDSAPPVAPPSRPTDSRRSGYLALCAITVIWSVNFTTAAWAMEEVNPVAFCFARGLAAATVFGAWLVATKGRAAFAAEHLRVAAPLALFGIASNQILFSVGLHMTSPPHSAVAISLIPVFVAVLAVFTRQERFSVAAALGVLLAFGGVFEINRTRGFALDAQYLKGDLVTLGAAATFAIYTLLMKRALGRYDPLHLIALAYVIAFFLLTPAYLATFAGTPLSGLAEAVRNDWTGLSARAWGGIAFATLLATILAYFLHTWALARIPASKVAAFTYCQPVLATAIAWAWHGDAIGPNFIFGSAAVLAGVALAQWGKG